jgi:MYXO-CTERM domain-containing protein
MAIAHGELLLSQKESTMTKTRFSTVVGMGLLASSLFLLPMTTATFAQTTNPTPQTRVVETRTEPDRTGLWGLLGLAGLLGLTGRKRRTDSVRSSTDTRERSRV